MRYLLIILTILYLSFGAYAQAERKVIHIVEKGDQLMVISNKYYNTHQRFKEIAAANQDIDTEMLKIGQRITIINPITNYVSKQEEIPAANIAQSAPIEVIADDMAGAAKELDSIQEIIEVKPIVKKKKKHKMQIAQKKKTFKPTIRKSNFAPITIFAEKKAPIVIEKVSAHKAEKKIVREIASVAKPIDQNLTSLKMKYNGWKNKYYALEDEYVKTKQQYNDVWQNLLSFREKEEDFAIWSREKRELEKELQETKDQLKRKSYENEKVVKKLPYYMSSVLATSQEQVIKEKTRILAQRLWIEKNKGFEKCVLNFPEHEIFKRDKFRELVVYLNATFGEDKVLVDPSINQLLVQLSGKTVYGVNDPKVRDSYKIIMTKISHLLRGLPLENIHFSGYSKFQKLTSETNKAVSAEHFALKQAITLQDYFIGDLGWDPHLFTAGTFGFIEKRYYQNEKYFNMLINFKNIDPKREIASISKDPAIGKIVKDIFKELHEPKYSNIAIKDKALEIHLARHYFFSKDDLQLTPAGKEKLNIIMEMFSKVDDVYFQIGWVSGQMEKDGKKNRIDAIKGLDKVKKYLNKKHSWTKNAMELQYQNRHFKLDDAFSQQQDRRNQRLVFRIVPKNILLREINEL